MSDVAIRIVIRGRVQGVGYRAWLEREAQAHGLSGWCRNLATGEVEAVLSGPAEAVNAVREACWRGPNWAKVVAVDLVGDEEPVEGGFSVKATA